MQSMMQEMHDTANNLWQRDIVQHHQEKTGSDINRAMSVEDAHERFAYYVVYGTPFMDLLRE